MTALQNDKHDYNLPPVAEPYYSALMDAVSYLQSRFPVRAVIAAGSVLRGCGHETSDLDLYIIIEGEMSRRISNRFNGVAVEMFLNPEAAIYVHFAREQAARRPCAAHMVATGHVVYDKDHIVPALKDKAKGLLESPPVSDENALTLARYSAANVLEDAFDVAASDPAASFILQVRAVHMMLKYFLQERGDFSPSSKFLVQTVERIDPGLGKLVREWAACCDFNGRLELANSIADCTIRARGFFEWESTPVKFI